MLSPVYEQLSPALHFLLSQMDKSSSQLTHPLLMILVLWPPMFVTLDTLFLVMMLEACAEEMAPVPVECGVEHLQLVQVISLVFYDAVNAYITTCKLYQFLH